MGKKMAKLLKINGFKVLETTAGECEAWGGFARCDICNRPTEVGYLILALGSWVCKMCFSEWRENFTNDPSTVDKHWEDKKIAYYENTLGLKIERENEEEEK